MEKVPEVDISLAIEPRRSDLHKLIPAGANTSSPAGCVANRELIIAWLAEAYVTATWPEMIRAGWRGAWMLNPLDPFGSLLDKAVN